MLLLHSGLAGPTRAGLCDAFPNALRGPLRVTAIYEQRRDLGLLEARLKQVELEPAAMGGCCAMRGIGRSEGVILVSRNQSPGVARSSSECPKSSQNASGPIGAFPTGLSTSTHPTRKASLFIHANSRSLTRNLECLLKLLKRTVPTSRSKPLRRPHVLEVVEPRDDLDERLRARIRDRPTITCCHPCSRRFGALIFAQPRLHPLAGPFDVESHKRTHLSLPADRRREGLVLVGPRRHEENRSATRRHGQRVTSVSIAVFTGVYTSTSSASVSIETTSA